MWKFKALITALGLLISPMMVVQSLRFDLKSGSTKCITEDIKNNAMTVGKYSVVNPNEGFPIPDTHKITVKVINFVYPFVIASQIAHFQMGFVNVAVHNLNFEPQNWERDQCGNWVPFLCLCCLYVYRGLINELSELNCSLFKVGLKH